MSTWSSIQNQRANLTSGERKGLASPDPDDGCAKAWNEEAQNGIRRRLWTFQQHVVVPVALFGCASKAEREQDRWIEGDSEGSTLDQAWVKCPSFFGPVKPSHRCANALSPGRPIRSQRRAH